MKHTNLFLLLRAAFLTAMIAVSVDGFSQCHGGGTNQGNHSSHSSSPGKSSKSGTTSLYVCPMHPEVQSEIAGTCPKCGMTLERKKITGSKASKRIYYYCQEHPSYESDKKGKCSTCGKKLKKAQEFFYE
ncbi:MAG: heavy metal-binding domain-containing protein [Bacteroidales bacterium]